MTDLFSLIKIYFELGLRLWEIVLSFSHIDGITISLPTLRRHLRTLLLFRRKALSDLLDIAMFLFSHSAILCQNNIVTPA